MAQIIVIAISFILTVIIGGKIAQFRQQDSWIAQQRFSGEEKEYFELKKLCDEIASSLGNRIYAMRRLVLQLIASSRHGTFDRTAVGDYQAAVKAWNENINSYYVRLTQLNLEEFRQRLEAELHDPMRRQSSAIDDALIERVEKGKNLVLIRSKLDKINADSLQFSNALLARINHVRNKIYFPEKIYFCRDTIRFFSTWILIKAIFVVDIDRISVVRSPLDP